MALDRPHAQHELGGDVVVGQSARDESQDLSLSSGETAGQLLRGADAYFVQRASRAVAELPGVAGVAREL